MVKNRLVGWALQPYHELMEGPLSPVGYAVDIMREEESVRTALARRDEG
jgi:hypothetical protein